MNEDGMRRLAWWSVEMAVFGGVLIPIGWATSAAVATLGLAVFAASAILCGALAVVLIREGWI